VNPLLDVAFLTLDPDFASSFRVVRRTEVVGTTGRNTFTNQLFKNVIGVITAGNDNSLDRREAFQVQPRTISVVTKFLLQGETEGKQPDIVWWRGSPYIVNTVESYAHFGAGFHEAMCSSTKNVDPEILRLMTDNCC